MPYVITTLCTNDGSCVEVCPVSCIHTTPGASQFYIDPEVCIDCEQCEIVCPVDAIFKDIDMPTEHTASMDVNGVTIVGAIGVAGSSRPDQDVLCCRAAMAVWENYGH